MCRNDDSQLYLFVSSQLIVMGSLAFPSQGTLNFLVFIRPRYLKARKANPNLSCLGAIREAIWNPTGSKGAQGEKTTHTRMGVIKSFCNWMVGRKDEHNSSVQYPAEDGPKNQSALSSLIHVPGEVMASEVKSGLSQSYHKSLTSSSNDSIAHSYDDLDDHSDPKAGDDDMIESYKEDIPRNCSITDSLPAISENENMKKGDESVVITFEKA
jgi:hypothetical protein